MKLVNLMKRTYLALVVLASVLTIGTQRVISATIVRQTQTTVAQTPTNNSTKAIVMSGTFVSGEHPTEGTARILSENGKYFLELDKGFKTFSMGPDLHVILHRSDNVIGSTKPPAYPIKEGEYVIISRLQKFNGAQRYAIPENINLADYQSAAIWCRKFNATFGAAKLSS